MAADKQKVIDIALGEVGYLEKASKSNLDDKTANAGSANITKYARDLASVSYFNGTSKGSPGAQRSCAGALTRHTARRRR